MTERDPMEPGQRPAWIRLAAMTLAAGSLYVLVRGFLAGPCWSLVLLAAVTAWPIWVFQRESELFHRRAVLAGITLEGSGARRAFWPGRLTAVLQVVAALGWAALLLAAGATLSTVQWWVLVADAWVLGLLVAPVGQLLRGQVRPEQLGFVARRWPLAWLNVVVLAFAFLLLDFFVVGAPDTRGLAWSIVAERSFADAGATASCRVAGWAVGGLAALDQLAWHAYQVLIPGLPRQDLKWAAWGFFLLQAGVLAFAYTRLQLGIVALLAGRERSPGPDANAGTKTILATLFALALSWIYAAHHLREFEPTALAGGARKVVAWANPCRTDAAALAAVRAELAADLERARAAAVDEANERIDRELDALFAEVERGVDRYLDWYFSVLGEYQRLGALVVGGFPALMNDKLEQAVAGASFDGRLQALSTSIAGRAETRMAALTDRVGLELQAQARSSPCRFEALNLSALGDLARDRQRFALAAGGGAVAGATAVTLLARRSATAVVGRLGTRTTVRVAGTVGGKTLARQGGSIVLSAAGATAICGPGGPLAALCGLGAGVVAWLAIDETLIRIDEYRFRAAMRAEMLEAAAEQKAELARDLRAIHHVAIERLAADVQRAADRAFIPARDGL